MPFPAHVKLYLQVAYHEKTIDAWENRDQRAVLVEILRMAQERFAATRGNRLRLRVPDVQSITCERDFGVGMKLLRETCAAVGYRVDVYPTGIEATADRLPSRVVVTVRNLAKRQGITDKTQTHKSEEEKSEEERMKNEDIHTLQGEPAQLELGDDPPEPEAPKPEPSKKRTAQWCRETAAKVWPELVTHIGERHGKAWMPKPSKQAAKLLGNRLSDGAMKQDLFDAIDGFVALHGDRVSPNAPESQWKFFRATTIFAPSKFEDYIEAARDTSRGASHQASLAADVAERLRKLDEEEGNDE